MKKISVIIPLYNSEKYIIQCVDSILNQDYDNIEIIIVNDGSTDKSGVLVCDKYKENKKVKYIYQNNFGAPSARNKGLEFSTGDYIVFFDSDDYMECNCLSQMMELFNENVDLVICGADEVDVHGNKIGIKKTNCKYELIDEKYEKYFYDPYPGNKIFKASIIHEYDIRFDNVRIGQDLNFYIKYSCFASNIIYFDRILSHYRIVESGISRTKNFNLFDIVNSLDYAFKFLNNHNVDNSEKVINSIKLSCYTSQLSKVRQYPFFKKKVVSKFFNYNLSILRNNYVLKKKYVILLKVKRVCWTLCSLI